MELKIAEQIQNAKQDAFVPKEEVKFKSEKMPNLQVSELKNTMTEIRNKLNERGEEINEMQVKSQQLKDTSQSFANNAEQLNKLFESRWF